MSRCALSYVLRWQNLRPVSTSRGFAVLHLVTFQCCGGTIVVLWQRVHKRCFKVYNVCVFPTDTTNGTFLYLSITAVTSYNMCSHLCRCGHAFSWASCRSFPAYWRFTYFNWKLVALLATTKRWHATWCHQSRTDGAFCCCSHRFEGDAIHRSRKYLCRFNKNYSQTINLLSITIWLPSKQKSVIVCAVCYQIIFLMHQCFMYCAGQMLITDQMVGMLPLAPVGFVRVCHWCYRGLALFGS